MNSKDLKIQIAFRVTKVIKQSTYGIDKKFVEKIDVGDMILITSDLYHGTIPNICQDSWEIFITNKNISKKFSSPRRVREIFNRIVGFEQIGLV